MKRILFYLALSGGLFLSQAAKAQRWAPPPPMHRVAMAPPPVRVEVRTVQPSPRHVWIGGYWGWNGGRHVWNPGRWDQGRQGHVWVEPRWENRSGYWQHYPGYWRPVGVQQVYVTQPVYAQPQPQPVYAQPVYGQPQPVYAQPVYGQPQPQPIYEQPQYAQPEYAQPQYEGIVVQQAPPPPQVEVIGIAPSPNHFWIGGHWGYYGGRYAWQAGRWEIRRPGYQWGQSSWIRHGGGWRYQRGGWYR